MNITIQKQANHYHQNQFILIMDALKASISIMKSIFTKVKEKKEKADHNQSQRTLNKLLYCM